MKPFRSRWRTDLVVFVLNERKYFNQSDFFFNDLNCSFSNRRISNLGILYLSTIDVFETFNCWLIQDLPMCTLVEYVPLRLRKFNSSMDPDDKSFKYNFFLNELDIFNDKDEASMAIFYSFLQEKISNYGYVDSILMAFDGYSYLSKAGYHFLIRSDMDVFLTPLFAKWLPRQCNDFYVGRGGYR